MYRSFASGIFDIIYGLNVDGLDHPLAEDSERITREIAFAAQPGSYLVDVFPFLKFVPSWMPGAGFKRLAKELVELQQRVIRIPFQEMLLQLVGLSVATKLPGVDLSGRIRARMREAGSTLSLRSCTGTCQVKTPLTIRKSWTPRNTLLPSVFSVRRCMIGAFRLGANIYPDCSWRRYGKYSCL